MGIEKFPDTRRIVETFPNTKQGTLNLQRYADGLLKSMRTYFSVRAGGPYLNLNNVDFVKMQESLLAEVLDAKQILRSRGKKYKPNISGLPIQLQHVYKKMHDKRFGTEEPLTKGQRFARAAKEKIGKALLLLKRKRPR